jgi:F0F1-type ATP synthase membrane subunit b/b'
MAEVEEKVRGATDRLERFSRGRPMTYEGQPYKRDKQLKEDVRLLLAHLRRERDEARAALAKEREECAKVAEKQLAPWVKEKIGAYWEGYRDAIEDAVEDIRARAGETR